MSALTSMIKLGGARSSSRTLRAVRARHFSSSSASLKERLAILGSGWGGYRVLQSIDKRRYDVTVISPAGYFNFTPLLAGAAVGTLEYRCATESVRAYGRDVVFHEAWADDIDLTRKQLVCTPSTAPIGPSHEGNDNFTVSFDKLVIAVGAYAQTFGVPGVKEHGTFLKTVTDARNIRQKVLERFEQASQPTLTDVERKGLLHFAIVGGGPTGIEFAAELHDLLVTDMPRYYPNVAKFASITVYEVSERILAAFDQELQDYAAKRFQREGITIRSQHHVEKVEAGKLFVKERGEVPFGLLVWSTGLALNPLVEAMKGVSKTKKALLTDGKLHLLDADGKPMPDVWAIGDCAMVNDVAPLPATAQVANQKAGYVTKTLNSLARGSTPTDQVFEFKSKGNLAYLGDWKALYDRTSSGGDKTSGGAAFLLWRSAYFATTLSIRNKIMVPFFWFMNWAFGRDVTRF